MSRRKPRTQSAASVAEAAQPPRSPFRGIRGPLLVALLGFAAYSNSFQGEFVFDDVITIVDNESIRSLWPLGKVLQPPRGGTTVEGRPLVNLTLALNYALGGLDVRGYHVFNLAVHLLAGCALLGCVRRALRLPQFEGRFDRSADALALVVALLWTLHPLQTESVTYVVQRAESLMGLFYLLTLYGALRALTDPSPAKWNLLAIAACAAGMASKEVMVSAPLMVALFDRTFVFRSWAEAWQSRKGLYVGLAGTWLLLAALVIPSLTRSGSAGLGQGVTSWEYLRTQAGAIARYLRLAFWPDKLVLDYGMRIARHPGEIVPYAIVVLALLAGTVMAWRRWPWVGFLGTWFFAVLAPTSSVVPIVTQTVAEHRMYLALAPLVILVVMAAALAWQRRTSRQPSGSSSGSVEATWLVRGVVAFVVLALGVRTYARNEDYRTEHSIWLANVRDWPQNPRIRLSIAASFMVEGDIPRALDQYNKAIEQDPEFAPSYDARGYALQKIGQWEASIADHTRSLALKPEADTYNNRGVALRRVGRLEEALSDHTRAIELKPHEAHSYYNRGVVLRQMGHSDAALADFTRALELRPDFPEALNDRGALHQSAGRLEEALADYSQAAKLAPDNALPWINRGAVYQQLGRYSEAVDDFTRALAIDPRDALTYRSRAACYEALGKPDLAQADLARAAALQ